MNLKKIDRNIYPLLIILIGILVFIPFLGKVHLFDWDEINFAESAREMIETGDYLTVQINFKPFWEKPPLFIWMQVLTMKLFGVNEFAARFPNAICGIVTLVVLFYLGRKIYNTRFGLIWVMTYLGSILTFLYFKSGIIDPWFNLFIFLGIWFIYNYFLEDGQNYKNSALSALFIGLAVLTKGPVAFLIFVLTFLFYLFIKKFRVTIKLSHILLFTGVLIFTGGFWFLLQILNGNFHVIIEFIEYQIRLFTEEDAGHGGFLLYHFVVLLIGVFPASVFGIRGMWKTNENKNVQKEFKRWMLVLFWVVLILFTIVNTKIVHYSSMCYFPFTFLGALFIYKIVYEKLKLNGWLLFVISIIGLVFILFVIALPVIHFNREKILRSTLIKDEFAAGNLQAIVNWSGFEILIGLTLLVGIILFIYYSLQKKISFGIPILFTASFLYIYLTMTIITPKIEGYSQRAAIEFFKDLEAKDVYVGTLGYKSYAHLFYSKKKKPEIIQSKEDEWLRFGDIDKDVYFSIKINELDKFLKMIPELELLYTKNGFAFCRRKVKKEKHDKQ